MGEVNVISAWDIYWVMQLDSINAGAFALAACSALPMFVCAVNGAMEKDMANSDDEWGRRHAAKGDASLRAARKFILPFVVFGAIAVLLPSTKTAAMMVVVPRIANNQAIQKEAGDLYGIAKDALRNLATPKQEPRK